MKKIITLLLHAVFTVSGAWAKDYEDLVLDQEYNITSTSSIIKKYYKYTATANGTLTFLGNGALSHYETEAGDSAIGDVTHSYVQMESGDTWNKYELAVVEGEVCYLLYKRYETSMTFTASLVTDEKPELTYIYPTEGDMIDVFETGCVSLAFSRSVSLGTATLSAGNVSAEVECNLYSGYYTIPVKTIVYEWFANGDIKGGDDITLTIQNVCAANNEAVVYGDNGTLTLSWKAPELIVALKDAVVPEPFLSWWDEGDSAGILTLTFTDELLQEGNTAKCTLGIGGKETESDEYYSEEVPVTISGNTLTVDFTGSQRTLAKMIPAASYEYNTMLITVSYVQAYDGNYVYKETSGSIGSFNWSVSYEDLGGDDEEQAEEEEYVFCDYALLTVDPALTTILTEDNTTFTLTFDGAVKIDADNSYAYINWSEPLASVEAASEVDENGCATAWTITVDNYVIKACDGGSDFSLVIVATDAEGRRIAGNSGSGASSVLKLTYETNIGVPDITYSPADGSTVESISTITASYDGGLCRTYSVTYLKIVLTDTEGNQVAKGVSCTENGTSCTITLSDVITAQGTYTLTLTAKFFYIGDESDEVTNATTTLTITVGEATGIRSIDTLDSLDGNSAIYNLNGQRLNAPAKGINIIGNKKVLVK